MLRKYNLEVIKMQSNAKNAAQEIINQMPEDASWSQLIYALQVREDIEAGLEEAEAGQGKTTEELRKSLGIKH